MSTRFPLDLDPRGVVKLTDRLLIDNIDTGVTEYTTVEELLEVSGYSGTKYWSCPGNHFDAENPDTDAVQKSTLGFVKAEADGIVFVASVNLPDGAVIRSVGVFGNAAAGAENWVIRRITLTTGVLSTMGSGLVGIEDDTIGSSTVNNSLYAYYLYTSSLDTNDEIWGARIKYTI